MKSLMISLLIATTPYAASAHNVISSVYVSGTNIEGEIGFSDGTYAKNQLVEIFDPSGAKIGEVHTDDEGFFVFTPQSAITHTFKSNLGAGHIAKEEISAKDIEQILRDSPVATSASNLGSVLTNKTTEEPSEILTAAPNDSVSATDISASLRHELKPLRREIRELRYQLNLQSIIGGIGYLVGIFGLWFYLAAKRSLRDDP